MKERERILELVKKGIISTEEALLLLENLAEKEGQDTVKKERASVEDMSSQEPEVSADKEPEKVDVESIDEEESYRKAEDKLREEQERDRQQLEAILEELANQASAYSVQLDTLNEKIGEVEEQKDTLDEKLLVFQTMEDLDELEPGKEEEMKQLQHQIDQLDDQLNDLNEERDELEDQMRSVKKKQWKKQKQQVKEKFEIPDEWKETAHKTLDEVNEKVSDAGSQLGKFLKDSFSSIVDSMEWKDVNVRVPGLVSTKFSHTFTYPETSASILNIKLANGNVIFKKNDSDEIKVVADIKLYGKLEENEEPIDAFNKRSKIELNEDSFTFHVPNKSVRADLVIYLPDRSYDHTQVKLLNGNVKFESFEGNDIYVKSTNGSLYFENFKATMLEAEGVNGSVNVAHSHIRDLMANSVNGSLTIRGNVKSSNLSTVNGTVRLTLTGEDIVRAEASSVNGAVKVSVPRESSLELEAKTNLGSIQNRLEETEVVKEKKERTNHLLVLRRGTTEKPIYLKLKTTTGTVMLKDGE